MFKEKCIICIDALDCPKFFYMFVVWYKPSQKKKDLSTSWSSVWENNSFEKKENIDNLGGQNYFQIERIKWQKTNFV